MIGLFGGSFDPIHDGHVHLARQLVARYPFKKILFIPNAKNPLKTEGAVAPGELRLKMIDAALQSLGDPHFESSRVEIDRAAPSFMIDTIRILKKSHLEPFVLIIGNEVFQTLDRWKEAKGLLETVGLVVVKRSAGRAVTIEEMLRKLHISTRSDKFPQIEEFVTEVLDLSSTEIRLRLKEAWKKDQLENTVPGIQRAVCELIKVNRLYAR